MRSFKLFWNGHKWTGIALSAVISCSAVTGFMLLVKKKVDWIQPATLRGAEGAVADFIPLQAAFDAVYALEHPDFRGVDDIDRVDVRPDRRVYKIQSKHHHSEAQVCAITGEVMGVATRRSDLIENIHDGSFFGEWAHAWLMPAVSVLLLSMVGSGLYLWVEPKIRRRRRKQRAALRAAGRP